MRVVFLCYNLEMKILLIDNGTTLLNKLQELIPGSEVTVKCNNIDIGEAESFDLIVLSGSSTSSVLLNHADFTKEIEIILKSQKPIIGICFGCELIVYAFGGKLKALAQPHGGVREIEITNKDYSNNEKIRVYEHHRYIIDELPIGFSVFAKSLDGPEAIKHDTLPIFGLQFHPENLVDDNDGKEIFTKIFNQLFNL
jgi:GMP synthase-like glutamine amidotransferase